MSNNIEIIIKKINKKTMNSESINSESINLESINSESINLESSQEIEPVFNFGKKKKKKKTQKESKETQKDSNETKKDSNEEELELLRTINGYILLQSDPIQIPIRNSNLYNRDNFDRIDNDICSSHN
jgi:hypothetical protein